MYLAHRPETTQGIDPNLPEIERRCIHIATDGDTDAANRAEAIDVGIILLRHGLSEANCGL